MNVVEVSDKVEIKRERIRKRRNKKKKKKKDRNRFIRFEYSSVKLSLSFFRFISFPAVSRSTAGGEPSKPILVFA